MTSTAPSEQFSDHFWKSQSMDTINQLLSGVHPMNVALTPVGSDCKVEAPSQNIPLSSTYSFSSLLPPLSQNNSVSASSQSAPSTGLSSTFSPISNPPSCAPMSAISPNPSSGQANEANVSSPLQVNTPPNTTNLTSMLSNFTGNQIVSTASSAIATSSAQSKEMVRVEKEPTYIDVTSYLILPQHEAARRLGIPCSTLSKRWKEASVNRKWPYRIVCKLDKEITTLLKNVENSANNISSPLSPAIEENLGLLLKKRQDELRNVVIRIN